MTHIRQTPMGLTRCSVAWRSPHSRGGGMRGRKLAVQLGPADLAVISHASRLLPLPRHELRSTPRLQPPHHLQHTWMLGSEPASPLPELLQMPLEASFLCVLPPLASQAARRAFNSVSQTIPSPAQNPLGAATAFRNVKVLSLFLPLSFLPELISPKTCPTHSAPASGSPTVSQTTCSRLLSNRSWASCPASSGDPRGSVHRSSCSCVSSQESLPQLP